MVILLALGAAFGFAVGQICVRVGLKEATPITAISISIVTMIAIVWPTLGPFIIWDAPSPSGVLLFMLAGVISPLATQILLFVSATRVGISRASPLRNTSPLFASLLAIGLLGERWTLPMALGTLFIIAGASLLGMRESGAPKTFRRRYLLLPLAAGFLGGFSSPLRKFGFSLLPSVPLATCAVLLGSLTSLVIYLSATGRYKELVLNRRTFQWFGLNGLCSGMAIAANLIALEKGNVVIVSPLIATVPLFTVLLSFFFLRAFERVTLNIAIGAGSICLGGILLIVF